MTLRLRAPDVHRKHSPVPHATNPSGLSTPHFRVQAADAELRTLLNASLCNASRRGRVAEVRRLVEEQGAAVGLTDAQGLTAVAHACMGASDTPKKLQAEDRLARQAVVEYLIGRGAPVDQKTRMGVTPLYICAQVGGPTLGMPFIQKRSAALDFRNEKLSSGYVMEHCPPRAIPNDRRPTRPNDAHSSLR